MVEGKTLQAEGDAYAHARKPAAIFLASYKLFVIHILVHHDFTGSCFTGLTLLDQDLQNV